MTWKDWLGTALLVIFIVGMAILWIALVLGLYDAQPSSTILPGWTCRSAGLIGGEEQLNIQVVLCAKSDEATQEQLDAFISCVESCGDYWLDCMP